MWRRLLVALGFAHRSAVVHGAVLPEHVLIHPAKHGLVLVDWCYCASGAGGCVPAIVERYLSWYPPEVLDRQAPGDAWRLPGEFDELLGRRYGPRRFRPFTMPA